MSRTFTIAGRKFALTTEQIEAALAGELPEPIRDHFVVVNGRRFPPKQVISAVTGLDRGDFTTHHAGRILARLGFVAGRRSRDGQLLPEPAPSRGPYGGRQAEALRPYIGKWVALGDPCEVLVAADTFDEVIDWLYSHGVTATGGMFRVPERPIEFHGVGGL